MDDLCRICLQIEASVPLFNPVLSSMDKKPLEMYNKFMICTSLQVSDNDKMPQALCETCSERLDIAYRLREQAQKSDVHLRHQLNVVKMEHSNNNVWIPEVNINKEEFNVAKRNSNAFSNEDIWDKEMKTKKEEALEEFNMGEETDDQSYESEFNHNESVGKFDHVKFSMKTNELDIKLEPFLRETIEKVSKSRKDTSLMAGSIKITKISKNTPKKLMIKKPKSEICRSGKYSVSIPIIYEGLSMSDIGTNCKNVKTKENSEAKKYQCKTCMEGFSSSNSYKTHRKKEHPKIKRAYEKKYMCDICGKTFDGRYGLETHTRVHTGERPYICKYCEKAFVRQSHMDIHIAARHLKNAREKEAGPPMPHTAK